MTALEEGVVDELLQPTDLNQVWCTDLLDGDRKLGACARLVLQTLHVDPPLLRHRRIGRGVPAKEGAVAVPRVWRAHWQPGFGRSVLTVQPHQLASGRTDEHVHAHAKRPARPVCPIRCKFDREAHTPGSTLARGLGE